mgnify:CR=1 FL=1
MFFKLLYTLCGERETGGRHGESPSPGSLLVKLIDKIMKNKLSIIRKRGDKEYEGGTVYWFSTR